LRKQHVDDKINESLCQLQRTCYVFLHNGFKMC
jgi:sRNA-binding regulator protein Hfq